MMNTEQAGGRIFREAWIQGVKTHYPGEPKQSYIAPWEAMREWEQECAIAVYTQVRAFLLVGEQRSVLTDEQGARLIRIAWVGQIYKHVPTPKPSYVSSWEDMPAWEQQVDRDIYTAILAHALQDDVHERISV